MSCAGCAYASIGGAAPDAASDDDGGASDASIDEVLSPGIAADGTACAREGLRACGGHASKLALECRLGSWEVGTTCEDDERCDSQAGRDLGRCRRIVEECADRDPARAFCVGARVRRCLDLVSFSDQSCQPGAACAADGGGVACVCEIGRMDPLGACVNVDECQNDHGGCDVLTSCTDTPGIVPVCGACPKGYVGNGSDGCAPTLSSLQLSTGTLTPAFDLRETAYTTHVSLATQRLTLTARVVAGAKLRIDGKPVVAGEAWHSALLTLGTSTITISVQQPGHPSRDYTLSVTRGEIDAYVKASNTGARDLFGSSLALSGNTLVVGAPCEDSSGRGANGLGDSSVQGNDSVGRSGAAYVFVRADDTGRWTQQAYLKASNTDVDDTFGSQVAISGDTLVVTATGEDSKLAGVDNTGNAAEQADDSVGDSGAAYVFVRNAKTKQWRQQAYLKASNPGAGDAFGSSVAVYGSTIVVGSPYEASAASGVDNDDAGAGQADDSSERQGAAYVFVRDDGSELWRQQAYLKQSNGMSRSSFGNSVGIWGETIAVGADGEGSSGPGVHDGVSAGPYAEGSRGTGAVYVFTRSNDSWSQQAQLKASNPDQFDGFGLHLAISGDTIVVGAEQEASRAGGVDNSNVGTGQLDDSMTVAGAAYVFVRSGSSWSQQAYLKAKRPEYTERFGASVAISGDLVLVGAPGESSKARGVAEPNTSAGELDNSADDSGALYVFARDGVTWTQQACLKASNTQAFDQLGISVAISDGLVIGATPYESSSAKGVDDHADGTAQANDDRLESGAVYVYR